MTNNPTKLDCFLYNCKNKRIFLKKSIIGGESMERILTKLAAHTPEILGHKHFSKYAVLVPLIKKNNDIHVLFEVRSLQLKRQPGEICFPGGKMDPRDKDEKTAAIRETKEELGISEKDISEIYPLDYMISPFGMMIYPYVGFLHAPGNIQPNPSEVEEVFTIPLPYFLENKPEIYQVEFKIEPEENFPFELITGGKNYKWRPRVMEEYFFKFEDKVIWGLTARILSNFIEIIKE
jgi:peroxisomal coenzyme A diphosphatase NUDT7